MNEVVNHKRKVVKNSEIQILQKKTKYSKRKLRKIKYFVPIYPRKLKI